MVIAVAVVVVAVDVVVVLVVVVVCDVLGFLGAAGRRRLLRAWFLRRLFPCVVWGSWAQNCAIYDPSTHGWYRWAQFFLVAYAWITAASYKYLQQRSAGFCDVWLV